MGATKTQRYRGGFTRDQINRKCAHKNRYADEMTARAAGQIFMVQYGRHLYIYKCELCHGWHLTKIPQPRENWVFAGHNYEWEAVKKRFELARDARAAPDGVSLIGEQATRDEHGDPPF